MRVNFWHQRLLSDLSSSLQEAIYKDLGLLEQSLLTEKSESKVFSLAQFFIERATIHIHHGFEVKAREDLVHAAQERSFHFALTGRLGKRTKYQQKELSQLVVLAASSEGDSIAQREENTNGIKSYLTTKGLAKAKPQALDLNDDTLLESIAFTKENESKSEAEAEADETLPPCLRSLDPGNQPLLHPLDAIILLATASSITNTSPTDGLTREETLPYAERVLSGGSSNWQVYTQALLVRSRIEGYRSRTIERGVLQLQAVVDQVIADTTDRKEADGSAVEQGTATNFLPKPQRSETASVSERLLYIHQLASPPRWKLEAELADRWVSLGGLRTALEIYERLQMWAEVALCWAANDREDKARKIIRRQLYNSVITTSTDKLLEDDEDNDVGDYRMEREPLPADAPRLFCILGDIEKSIPAYERAWEISNHRYARAQRSLGKHYSAVGDLEKADEAYAKSLKVNPQNHPTWFALGCVRLLLEDWSGAVDAFGRAVQIEDSDAESWSNLAVALLKLPPSVSLAKGDESTENAHQTNGHIALDDDDETQRSWSIDPQRHIREAFVALKRAASLKRESYKIWQNLLSVAVKLSPPPYADVVIAQTRLIDLLGSAEGERCVDFEIVERLVAHLILLSGDSEQDDSAVDDREVKARTGLEKMINELVQNKVTPLITSSRRLWLLTAKLSLHLRRPAATLAAYEKAWRVTLNRPGWDSGAGTAAAKDTWVEVKESTIDLVDAYESLGERARESGMGAGEPVAKDWKFKARSALRSVLARAREGWEGDAGYEMLAERLQGLKSAG
ncbi:tetratricopeptide repeat protein 27, partial [Lecanoromycetidae sp. Uapishka_2]